MTHRRLPTAALSSSHSFDCVRACLKADGYVMSELIAEWMWNADEKRRDEIDEIINGAIWTTMHMWA